MNSRVDARVVALVDGRTYGRTYVRTEGKPDTYIAPCMRQARQKCKWCNGTCSVYIAW